VFAQLRFDAEAFSGHVPLFPLPGVVLLPGNVLPLHVFEPRYRALVEDALAGERLIAPALLKPGYEADYEGAPAIEEHVCLGRVILDQRLPDGRWNVVLLGLRRARVVDEDRSGPFRRARVELIDEEVAEADEDSPETAAVAAEFAAYLEDLPAGLVRDIERLASAVSLLRAEVPANVPFGLAIDLASEALLLGTDERQQLLGEGSPAARLQLLRARLDERAAPRRGPPRSKWPPRFSVN